MLDKIISDAILEDIPTIDVTTDNIFKPDHISEALLISKEKGVISGLDLLDRVFSKFSNNYTIELLKKCGDEVAVGEVIAKIKGQTITILKGERIALNLIQRMSGIATITSEYVKLTDGFETKILDTRKTTPNLRVLEKRAVLDGGGTNHRFSLSDMSMIKDNHIKAAGSIEKAVELVKKNSDVKVEVEVENISMFEAAVSCDCDIIMLDNMSVKDMKKCVDMNNNRKILEASGNMTLSRIREVASVGVDYISVGALTHSVKSLDISLKFK